MINIYGPNRDTPDFYTKIKDIIIQKNYTDIIWGGDWNLVLNPNIDYMNYKNNNNPRAQATVLEIKDTLELSDVWREINIEMSRFTWRRQNPFQQSRLDFFLTSETLLPLVKETDIIPGYRTDHSFITLKLEFKKEDKQKTYWKFNTSLLKDTECIKVINETIDNIIKQYAIPVYNFENIDKIRNEIQFTISEQLFLDVLLMEIRSTILAYSAKKRKNNLNQEKIIEQEICELEAKVNKTLQDLETLTERKQTLQNIRKTKMDGILTRSRANWAAHGEKTSKYFCGLEKRHYISKQMFKLVENDGSTTTETTEMVEKTRIFYEKL